MKSKLALPRLLGTPTVRSGVAINYGAMYGKLTSIRQVTGAEAVP